MVNIVETIKVFVFALSVNAVHLGVKGLLSFWNQFRQKVSQTRSLILGIPRLNLITFFNPKIELNWTVGDERYSQSQAFTYDISKNWKTEAKVKTILIGT